MASIFDNPEREKVLRRGVGEVVAISGPLVIGVVAQHVPDDFDLDDSELAEMLRDMKLAGQATAAPVTPVEPTPVPEAAPEREVRISRQAAEYLLQVANAKLDGVRFRIRTANEALKDRQADLAKAITAWQLQADPLSPAERAEREKRNFLASEQQRRAANPRRGLERGAEFVQRRMVTGKSRGAYPRQYQHRVVKLPSQA